MNIRTIAFSTSKNAIYGGAYTANYSGTPSEPMVRQVYTVPSRFSSEFYYDPLGRLVVSQNARQYNNVGGTGRKYSYTLYDALGRVVEVGEKSENSYYPQFKDIFGAWVSDYYNPSVIDEAKLLDWINGPGERREVTKSYYDATVITGLPATFTPNVLTQRKRITHVTYEETFDNNDQTYDHATHYDYDIHGNVKTLLQDNRKMKEQFSSLASQQFKRLDYRYDLVSGNVHRMSVQNGEVDQWHHAYQYDADNRITAAYTNSRTPLLSLDRPSSALSNELAENEDWENDAKYEYYAHGPLARTEIGDKKLQGFDYLYNLQGWMKGINAIENSNDPGQDGFSGVNSTFGKDLTAFSLEYFNNDYQAINNNTHVVTVNSSSHPATNSSQLFNGNIRYMQTRLTNPTTLADMPMLNAYKYDQLNRLKESRSYESGLSSNVWNPTTYGNEYYNAFEYDAMGNILTQKRHKRDGTKIEDLSYSYQTSGGKLVRNRLYHLDDVVGSGVDATDIDDMGTFDGGLNINTANNYSYDEEGRLVKDVQEGISKIVWRVDGKVKEIQRNVAGKKWLRFDYDAMGNRIAKHVFSTNGTTLERSTYYILDAQGNQISTYDHEVVSETAQFNLKERNIYGSSRIGSKQDSLNVLTATITQNYSQILGNKYFEFSNHLGNVLTVFSDLKIPKDTDNNNVVDEYEIGIVSTADYSPFGVELDGRSMRSEGYRYGFNSMEKDDEVKGIGNSYDFGARMYDARVGRWLTIDPLAGKQPYASPYKSFLNNPIYFIDPKGETEYSIHIYIDERTGKKTVIMKAISTDVMTDGHEHDVWTSEASFHKENYYYDFATVYVITTNMNGRTTVSMPETVIFNDDKTKKKHSRYAMFGGHAKYEKYSFWSPPKFQPGGIAFTSENGGAQPVKILSESGSREVNIDVMLAVLGKLNGTSLGSKYPDLIKDATGLFTSYKEDIEEKFDYDKHNREQEAKNNKTQSNNDKVHEMQTKYDHNGKRSKGPEGPISRTQADREENAGGKYNKTRDTIYTFKKGF